MDVAQDMTQSVASYLASSTGVHRLLPVFFSRHSECTTQENRLYQPKGWCLGKEWVHHWGNGHLCGAGKGGLGYGPDGMEMGMCGGGEGEAGAGVGMEGWAVCRGHVCMEASCPAWPRRSELPWGLSLWGLGGMGMQTEPGWACPGESGCMGCVH